MALIRTAHFAIDGDKILAIVHDEAGGTVVLTDRYYIEVDCDCAQELLAAIGPAPDELPAQD